MTRDRSILIIGAGPNQLPAIELAKRRGFRVAATDRDPQAVGFALADVQGVVSTRDVQGTIRFARRLADQSSLDGVMTMASESAVTVASTARALGLPGLDPAAAARALHKVDRQRCFRNRNVPAPRFEGAATAQDAIAAAEAMGFPVVVKPADSAGSRGVRKVNSAGEMKEAVEEIRRVSQETEFLVEQYLTGAEHSIEGVVIDGRVFWTAFSDRNYDKKEIYPPYFLEDGDTMPTALPRDILRRARDAATEAVRALGIDWGPVKGDILVDEGGPKILEMAARLSGDYFCYETAPLHNGVRLLDAVMDLSMGETVDPSDLAPKFHRGVALRYLWPKPGMVREIRGVEEVRATPGVHFLRWEPRWRDLDVGTEILPARSMGDRVGCVMTCADSREAAVRLAEWAVAKVKIVTERRIERRGTGRAMGSIRWIEERLPPMERIELRCEPDRYGASSLIASQLGRKAVPMSHATWSHGWQDDITRLRQIEMVPSAQSLTHLVATESQAAFLRRVGLRRVAAVGLPIVYVEGIDVARRAGSLLVMPVHSLPYTDHDWNYLQYAETIAQLAPHFSQIVACVHQSCVEKGLWTKEFDRAGVPWIVGAALDDKNALLRMMTLFKSFEYVTTNRNGSHLPYAAYAGCKISIYGEYAELEASSFEKDPFYVRNPDLLRERLGKNSENAAQRRHAWLFVPPMRAAERRDWGSSILGAGSKVAMEEIADLLGWSLSRRLKRRAWRAATYPKRRALSIRRSIRKRMPRFLRSRDAA